MTEQLFGLNCVFFRSAWRKALGLMFQKPKRAYIFVNDEAKSTPITMLFVFHAIDIIWVDERGKILAVKRNALPFTLHINPNVKAKYVIELPKRTLSTHFVLKYIDFLCEANS